MARQNGIIPIEGTLGNISFYRTKDGMMARTKTSVNKSRIQSDAAFQRTRENGKEFGEAGKTGKMLRDSIRALMLSAADGRVTSRLTKLMSQILKLDVASKRGDRTVAAGMKTQEGKAKLKGFNFNIQSMLGSVLFKPFTLNTSNGNVTIFDLTPVNDIVAPPGATHVAIKSAVAVINFAAGTSDASFSDPVGVLLDGTKQNINLTIPTFPTVVPDSITFHFLKMEFYQEVNGVQYMLNNGTYNCLEITEVV